MKAELTANYAVLIRESSDRRISQREHDCLSHETVAQCSGASLHPHESFTLRSRCRVGLWDRRAGIMLWRGMRLRTQHRRSIKVRSHFSALTNVHRIIGSARRSRRTEETRWKR